MNVHAFEAQTSHRSTAWCIDNLGGVPKCDVGYCRNHADEGGGRFFGDGAAWRCLPCIVAHGVPQPGDPDPEYLVDTRV